MGLWRCRSTSATQTSMGGIHRLPANSHYIPRMSLGDALGNTNPLYWISLVDSHASPLMCSLSLLTNKEHYNTLIATKSPNSLPLRVFELFSANHPKMFITRHKGFGWSLNQKTFIFYLKCLPNLYTVDPQTTSCKGITRTSSLSNIPPYISWEQLSMSSPHMYSL